MTESEQPAQQPGPIADPATPMEGVSPEQQPGTPPYGPVPPQFGAPYGAPPGYPPPGYPQPYPYGYGYAPPQQGGTNGMAIAAMICGICGFICLVPGLVGIVLGLVALPQIKRREQSGKGMAITGIVMGGLWIIGVVLLIVFHHSNGQVSVGTNDGTGG